MKNEKNNNKIIYASILVILIYCVIIAIKHPMSSTLVTVIILPLLYIGSTKISNLKVKTILTKTLSIVYGITSVGILLICILSGFVENGTIYVAMNNLFINSPLILAFLLLSIFGYKNKTN